MSVDTVEPTVLPGLTESAAAIVRAVIEALTRAGQGRLNPEVVEHALTDRAVLAEVLNLLTRSPALRAKARAELIAAASLLDLDDDTVGALLDPDNERSRAAADSLLSDVAKAVRDARSSRRRARRSSRPSAQDRADARDREAIAAVRAARDKARTGWSSAQDEIRQLQAALAETQEALDTASSQLAAAQARATSASQAGIAALSARLAQLLTPPARPQRVTDTGDRAHLRLVDPGRADKPSPIDVDSLTRLARTAGLDLETASRAAVWLPELLRLIADPPRQHVTYADLDFTVEALGAYDEVAGSAVLVSAGGTRILIDAGTRPGATPTGPKRISRALTGRLDAVVVTHAHNDHAGWVPKVIASHVDVPVYATDPTLSLMSTMLADSIKMMARRDGGTSAPYGKDEVAAALSAGQALDYGQTQRAGDLGIELFPAGHIVGAAGVIVRAGERSVVVTGDVSGPGQMTVGGWQLPDDARDADLLVLESTYGALRIGPRSRNIAAFISTVTAAIERGGRVLIPAFALGRAQEIALLVQTHLPEVRVLIDGLARDVSEIYQGLPGPDGEPLRVFGPRSRPVPAGQTLKAIREFPSGVIIATSGMLSGGPAVAWAKDILPDPDGALLVVGYQDEASPGRALIELAEAGGGQLSLPGLYGAPPVEVGVNASVGTYQLGAHASASELLRLAAHARAREVMLVHGDGRAQGVLGAELAARRQRVVPNHRCLPVGRR